jgi:hypothetical protein
LSARLPGWKTSFREKLEWLEAAGTLAPPAAIGQRLPSPFCAFCAFLRPKSPASRFLLPFQFHDWQAEWINILFNGGGV